MNNYIDTTHFIALAPSTVAKMLANPVAIDEDGDARFSTGELAQSIPGMPETTVISLASCDYDGPLHRAIQKTFGDTRAPKHIADYLIDLLAKQNLLTTRRVLAEDLNGSDAVINQNGDELDISLGSHLAGTNGKAVRFNAWRNEGVTEIDSLPNHGVRLSVVEYPTMSTTSSYDDTDSSICSNAIEDILQHSAVGDAKVYAILGGPLKASQMSMYDNANDCRHVQGPGFIGQFLPQGNSAEFLYMIANDDGKIVSVPYAL